MIKMVTDGSSDGGVDALLLDPESENKDLILVQSKYYQNISQEDIRNAFTKMFRFYDNLINGRYDGIRDDVVRRFVRLNDETTDDSKIVFVLYTSAPKNRIDTDAIIEELLRNRTEKFDLKILFDEDILREIKEAQEQRPSVAEGELRLDKTNNCLEYGDGSAVIVNISAHSLKKLYASYSNTLFSMNLRYFIKKTDIDKAVADTIRNTPDWFWFKNNGLTIVCDDFKLDGTIVRLKNFSIVNGGQTTNLIYKSSAVDIENDFYLPCKIIRSLGDNDDKKLEFTMGIAQATNSQKAIKKVDLKSNTPEQIRFIESMRRCGVFYRTRRGQEVPNEFQDAYLNTALMGTGTLALIGIFQMPGTGRSKPSALFDDRYYDPIFFGDQIQIASYIKDLMYVDWYFNERFIDVFRTKSDAAAMGNIIPFANNARTLCVAFTSLIARFWQKNITVDKIDAIFKNYNLSEGNDILYNIFKDMGNVTQMFPNRQSDDLIDELFSLIIKRGYSCFTFEKGHDPTVTETNFLKKDINYYKILHQFWPDIIDGTERIKTKFFD